LDEGARKIIVSQMYYVSRVLGCFALLGLALAAFFSFRLAQASAEFDRHSPESVARALEILPRNTDYLSLRALQLEYDGENPAPLLERAAAINPLSSAPRIRLGLAAETRGDLPAAERWLLEAARVDHQFEPRWSLANFYFRQAREVEFWKWMHAALEVSYGDRARAFDLCWRLSQDAQEIFERAIPDESDVLGAYLAYVLSQHRDAAGPVAVRLAALRDPAYTALLEASCDSLLDSGNATDAREVWRLLRHSAPRGVANGDFASPPVNHGFDWRLLESAGVSHVHLDPSGHRIQLSGKQPEACDLLRQIVAVEKGKQYDLRWETRTQSIASPSGIEWSVAGRRAPVAAAEDWQKGAVSFTAPADLVPVTLVYRRPTGQPRAEGFIEIRSVSLKTVSLHEVRP
jgi:tetratricopeptide (TPR) repeat protein